jgi:hypothetical protein
LNHPDHPFPPRIISIHVPKTAGSSLHSQFVALFGDRVALDIAHDPFTAAGQQKGTYPDGKAVLHGHFAARRYEAENAFWLTFLRNPIDNLISIYFYWKSIHTPAQELHRRFLTERPTIVELAKYNGLQRLFSETYFGGFDMRRFSFVGFHESRDRDIPWLGSQIGLPLRSEVHINASDDCDERQSMTNNAQIRSELASILSDDMRFYEGERHRAAICQQF